MMDGIIASFVSIAAGVFMAYRAESETMRTTGTVFVILGFIMAALSLSTMLGM